jgi:hypothetical protein
LRQQGVGLFQVTSYFREAFLVSGQANIALIPKLVSGEPNPQILDSFIADLVDGARQRWEQAPPYPDLMRRRDRIAFEQVARRHDIVLIVCAADRAAARDVGRSRDAAAAAPGGSPCYRLHGAYERETGRNAWTAREGEQLRAELNRRLGAELVRAGPHDTWAERLDLPEDDPRRGPMPPVLFFLPDGDVQVRTDARGMELYYRFLEIDWAKLYRTTRTEQTEEENQ